MENEKDEKIEELEEEILAEDEEEEDEEEILEKEVTSVTVTLTFDTTMTDSDVRTVILDALDAAIEEGDVIDLKIASIKRS